MREAGGLEHLHARFFESENEAGGECSRGVVKRFFFGGDVHGDAAEGTRDEASNADGGGVTLDGEDFSFERRNGDTVEGLHRVHRSRERTEGTNGLQDAGVARAACVQNDFPAELLSADAGEFGGNFGYVVIGYADQNSSGGQDAVGDARDRLTGADEFGRFAGGGFGTRGDDENVPATFVVTS